jgi:hypothetical protein
MYELEDPLTAVQMLQAYVDIVCRKRSGDDITSDLAAFFNTWNHRLSGPFAVLEGYFAYIIGLSLGFKINAVLDRMGDDARRQLYANLRGALKTAIRELAERRGKGGEK